MFHLTFQSSINLDPAVITALVGAALALIFEYFPKLNTAYNALDNDAQKKVMLFLVALATVIVVYNQCQLEFGCYTANWQTILFAYLSALGVNQGLHRALPTLGKPSGPK